MIVTNTLENHYQSPEVVADLENTEPTIGPKSHEIWRFHEKVKKGGPSLLDKFAMMIPPYASSYLKLREACEIAIREVLKYILDDKLLDFQDHLRKGIVEFGCGPDAYFFNQIPEEYKSFWTLLDIHPHSVVSARRNAQGAREVRQGSFHKKLEEEVGAIFCFNSLDSTPFFEICLQNFYGTLIPGGVVVVAQDVLPAESSTLARIYLNTKKKVVARNIGEAISKWVTTDGRRMHSREYLASRLERTAQGCGFEVLSNEIIAGTLNTERRKAHSKWRPMNKFVNGDPINGFRGENDPSIERGKVLESEVMDVLILQKT